MLYDLFEKRLDCKVKVYTCAVLFGMELGKREWCTGKHMGAFLSTLITRSCTDRVCQPREFWIRTKEHHLETLLQVIGFLETNLMLWNVIKLGLVSSCRCYMRMHFLQSLILTHAEATNAWPWEWRGYRQVEKPLSSHTLRALNWVWQECSLYWGAPPHKWVWCASEPWGPGWLEWGQMKYTSLLVFVVLCPQRHLAFVGHSIAGPVFSHVGVGLTESILELHLPMKAGLDIWK